MPFTIYRSPENEGNPPVQGGETPTAEPTGSTWLQRVFKTGTEMLADPSATPIERFLAGLTVGMRSVPSPFRPLSERVPEQEAPPPFQQALETVALPLTIPFAGLTKGLEEAGAISPRTTEQIAKSLTGVLPLLAGPIRPGLRRRSVEPLRAKEALLEKPKEVKPLPDIAPRPELTPPRKISVVPEAAAIEPISPPPITGLVPEAAGTTLGSLGGALQEATAYLPESVRKIPEAYRAQVQKGIDYIAAKTPKHFREARGLGEEFVGLIHDRGATMANYVERAVELGGRMKEGLTPAEKTRVDQVLRGGITVNPAIAKIVEPARALINELQTTLVNYGYLTPEQVELFSERFRTNPEYLRRLYSSKLLAPETPTFATQRGSIVGAGTKSEALLMRGELQEVKLPSSGGVPLVGRERADFLQPYLKKGYRLLKADGDSVTLFRDIPEVVRKAMGEIRGEPGFVAAKTIAEQGRIVANHEFLEAIRRNPDWAKAGLTEGEYTSGEWVQLPGDKRRWGPLADHFVKKDVAKEVTESIRLRQDWEKVVGRLVGMWKYGKVILNPAAMGRNTVSSAILADFGGLHPWMIDEYAKGAADLAKGGGYVSEAKNLGLFRSAYSQQEITHLANGLLRSQSDNGMLRMLDALHDIGRAIGEKTHISPSKLYGAIENFYRYNLYRFGRDTMGLNPKDARRYAQKYAIDYEVVSPAVATLRGTGGGVYAPLATFVAAPFATFAAKAIPLTLETLALHPLRVLKYPALIYGVGKLAESQIGQTPAETRAQRRLGEMNAIRYMLLPIRDKDGRAQYLDLGYTLPFGDLLEFGDMILGETGRRANISFLPVVGHPAFTIAEAILNKSGFTGKEIVSPADTATEGLRKRVEYIAKNWGPSLMPPLPGMTAGGYAWEDLQRARLGKSDWLGRTRSPVASILANITGIRAKGVTTAELADFKARQYLKQLDAVEREMSKVASELRYLPGERDRELEKLSARGIEIAREAGEVLSVLPGARGGAVPPVTSTRAATQTEVDQAYSASGGDRAAFEKHLRDRGVNPNLEVR